MIQVKTKCLKNNEEKYISTQNWCFLFYVICLFIVLKTLKISPEDYKNMKVAD